MYRRLDAVGARLEESGSMHAKGPEAMAGRLGGGNASALSSLRVFLGAIEPVKGYERGSLQPWSVQSTPLAGIPDCVPPESRAARIFSDEVGKYLDGTAGARPAGAAAMLRQLDSWRDAGAYVAGTLAPRSAALGDAAPLARALADASATGREALDALEGGMVKSPKWLKDENAALDRCAKPVSAAELPMIAAIRRLVGAAGVGRVSP